MCRYFLLFVLIFLLINQNLFGQESTISDTVEYSGELNYDLLLASYYKDHNKILDLLNDGADVNTLSLEGISPLMYAVGSGSLNIVRILVVNGANINRVPEFGLPALTTAVINNYFEIAEYLIKKDANILLKDINARTPLMHACKENLPQMVDWLLYYGAKTETKDYSGNTALHIASYYNFPEIVSVLLKYSANVNATDKKGFTPIMIVAQNNNIEVINILIKNGAKVSAKNNLRFDALSLAIKHHSNKAVELLIEHNVDINVNYQKNIHPIEIAKLYGNVNAASYLKENGVKVTLMPKFHLVNVGLESCFNNDRFFSGMQLKFYDVLHDFSIYSGFLLQPYRNRVLIGINDNIYNQYWERRFIANIGICKNHNMFRLVYNQNLFVFYGFDVNYSNGNYRGTNKKAEQKIFLAPKVGIGYEWQALKTEVFYKRMNLPGSYNSLDYIGIGLNIKIMKANESKNIKKMRWQKLDTY